MSSIKRIYYWKIFLNIFSIAITDKDVQTKIIKSYTENTKVHIVVIYGRCADH
jgi:hypothetical protein